MSIFRRDFPNGVFKRDFPNGEDGMEAGKISEKFVQNLLIAMPVWHSKLVRPFKDTLNGETGDFPVILSPEAAGVFAHESFGHKSEADFMLGDESMKKE